MNITVIGAGGHAKAVIATLQAAGHTVVQLLDDDPARWGSHLLDVEITGPVDLAAGRCAFIAIGGNTGRRQVAERLPGARWVIAVHPRACVHPSARLGPGSIVMAGAVIQPDASLGAHCIINALASVSHDCQLGDFVHLAPGARLTGFASAGEGAFLGANSTVIPGRRVGAWSTVGAGAVVTRDLPDGCTAVGVPARAIRPPGT